MQVCDPTGRFLRGKLDINQNFKENPFKYTLALYYLKKKNIKESVQSVSTVTTGVKRMLNRD